MTKLVNVSFLILYCSFIFWLSSQSALPTPVIFNAQDKLLHMGAYFVMAILAWRSFTPYFSQPISLFFVSLGFCSLYGLSDEWHQSFVPGRYADTLDWVADTLGAFLALLALTFLSKTKNIKPRRYAK